MRIQTFSIVAGSAACNARCPFCVSKMTPPNGVALKEPEVNWRNFRKACVFARHSGVTTAMLTSKGEATIFPDQITRFLEAMQEFEFPFIELQTNGILFSERKETYRPHLRKWLDLGMTTIAISVVHYNEEKNRQVYLPHKNKYIDLPGLIDMLHEIGFSVRIACILAGGFIDNTGEVGALLQFAKTHKVEQLKICPVTAPESSIQKEAYDWTNEHSLSGVQIEKIREFIVENGNLLMRLMHGGEVYDVDGQNICLSNCLTIEPESDDIRQLIFFPDGHLRYDWQYPGAILL